ncbi:MAG: DUF3137 domain-containing protein [Candidatus Pristimantibacillus lignocellulolyticus]|uniref:DUF3137 domain-containing protein n=1 Tax=Candidatus Pristimantibacillus lignocellulolyticus TaxID=2994561 RepID=A0A9J6ZI48_9BACL|nr:MAG: DUF3137 domain-containing protein [Candidatus Pristimantibacillus lignocellulolyticus]
MLPTYGEVNARLTVPLEELDHIRELAAQKLSKYYKILWILFFINVISTIISLSYHSYYFIIGWIILIIIASMAYLAKQKSADQYRTLYKSDVVAPFASKMVELCATLSDSEKHIYYCNYYPQDRMDDRWIQSCKLFDFTIDKTTGEDLLIGQLGLTEFRFSELTLIEITETTDSKGNRSTTEETRFSGVLFVADFKKDFSGITILQSRNVVPPGSGLFKKMFGSFKKYSMVGSSRAAKIAIELESEQFNAHFNVRTSNDIEARYLLSPNLMEQILEFKKSHSEQIDISFVDSYMCIAIASDSNYFEEPMHKTNVAGYRMKAVYEDLKFFFGLIEEFDLNTRIWSKY